MPKVNYFEIPAKDPKKINDFYAKVFDWKLQPWGDKYWMIDPGDSKDDGISGGIYLSEKMTTVMNTIAVPDINLYIERIIQNDGQILDKPQAIGDLGWHVYFKDPEGTIMGVMQYK
jgi:uncharacterized protein